MAAEVRRRAALWVVPIALPLYAVAKFGGEFQAGGGLPSALLLIAAFFLAIAVYASVASVTYAERFWSVIVGAGTAFVISLVMTGEGHLWMLITSWAALLGPPLVVGRLHRLSDSRAGSYQLGLTVLLVFILLYYLPKWPEMVESVRRMADWAIARLQTNFSLGFGSQQQAVDVFFRLAEFLPAAMIMTSILQYSVGTLWFYERNPHGNTTSVLVMFRHWKMPRWLVVPAVVTAALRVTVPDDTLRLAADNLLLCLGLFYAAFGLSALEYFMHMRRFPVWLRVIIYVVVLVAHFYGLLVCAVLGLVDSLFGWRKQNAAEAKEKETVSQ